MLLVCIPVLIIARRGRGSGRRCTSGKPYKAVGNQQNLTADERRSHWSTL